MVSLSHTECRGRVGDFHDKSILLLARGNRKAIMSDIAVLQGSGTLGTLKIASKGSYQFERLIPPE